MAEMVKAKILELKQSNVEPPITLYAKIKDFQEKVVEYNALLQSFKDKKETLHELKNELSAVQTKVFSAKIINHSVWKEYNEVRFHLISPPMIKSSPASPYKLSLSAPPSNVSFPLPALIISFPASP